MLLLQLFLGVDLLRKVLLLGVQGRDQRGDLLQVVVLQRGESSSQVFQKSAKLLDRIVLKGNLRQDWHIVQVF